MNEMTIEEARAHVERCKFVCAPGEDGRVERDRNGNPRELVHCFLGGLGADWDTYAVFEELEHAESFGWGEGFLGVGLAIVSTWDKYGSDYISNNGLPRRHTYYFDTVTPPKAG